MDTIKTVAREISIMVPKLISRVKSDLIFREDITAQQMVTILTIGEIGEAKVTVIAKRMGVSPPTITGLLDRLQKKGFLKRFRDSKDRRIVFVNLTKKGYKFVEKLKKCIEQRWSELLSYLTEEERLTYLEIVRKLFNSLKQEKE